MCFYLRNWQVTFLLYTLGVFLSEYIAKAPIEPRDYRVVFFTQRTACFFGPVRVGFFFVFFAPDIKLYFHPERAFFMFIPTLNTYLIVCPLVFLALSLIHI